MTAHDEMTDMPPEPGTSFLPSVELTPEDEAELAEQLGHGAELYRNERLAPYPITLAVKLSSPLDPPVRVLGPVVDLLPYQRGD